jgi:hypothetical protein
MLVIALVMLVILVVAALVVTFAAFPHRGEEVPAAPWLGEAMTKAADALPTLDNPDAATPQPVPDGSAVRPAPGRRDTGSLF